MWTYPAPASPATSAPKLAGVNRDAQGETAPLDAGEFSAWLISIDAAVRGDGESDVACGSCTACCTASQFVHILPTETATLARIPKALLFPAPRLSKGHVLLGYNERGHCPMLVNNQCSIYEDRPQTCRTYDCRVFAAADVYPDDDETKALIAEQAKRWRFTYADDSARGEHDVIRATAAALSNSMYTDDWPDDARPRTTTQLAVAAVARRRPVI